MGKKAVTTMFGFDSCYVCFIAEVDGGQGQR